MSAVFYHDESQRAAIAATRERFVDEPETVTTVVAPLERFWLAEDYHQKYRLRGEDALLRELQAFYPETADLVGSTAAARINGYLAGHGEAAQFEQELELLGLSSEGRKLLRSAR